MRFKSYTHSKKDGKPIFIIGQCPGKQRKKDQTGLVFQGNRTGDLIQEVIKDFDNIHLTNIFNVIVPKITPEVIQSGSEELLNEIKELNPSKVICLGKIAQSTVSKLVSENDLNLWIVNFQHPSYILRFNKNKEEYKARIKEELK